MSDVLINIYREATASDSILQIFIEYIAREWSPKVRIPSTIYVTSKDLFLKALELSFSVHSVKKPY